MCFDEQIRFRIIMYAKIVLFFEYFVVFYLFCVDFLRVWVGCRYGYPMMHLRRGYCFFLFVFVQFFVVAEFQFAV